MTPHYATDVLTLYCGDVLAVLAELPAASVQCCVTSPPYWGLRHYGVDGQLGLEPTHDAYVAALVAVFREVRRVLRPDGVCWLNLGDSYSGSGKGGNPDAGNKQATNRGSQSIGVRYGKVGETAREAAPKANVSLRWTTECGIAPKQLIGIPWRVAFALQADGWWLRSDVIWCLSGGTWLYVRTAVGGVCMMTVKDMARLNPATVELWNGEKWTRLLGTSRSRNHGLAVELVLRSGERIACTSTHRFPTTRGVLPASDIRIGDVLSRTILPDSDDKPCAIDDDAAWFAGLYLAEGSRSGDTIQISGHAKESDRWRRVCAIADKFGGSCTKTVDGNAMSIRVYGRVLNAIVDELVTGRTAKDKGFSASVWRRSNRFVAAMLDGYLSGDGHWDMANRRWRLSFCRNYNLERDLRTACARLGYRLVLTTAYATYRGRRYPSFKGEIRKDRSGRWNQRDSSEVVAVRRSRCRYVYDIGVADEPHLFALASGILTHNSKPNPMPESVEDRPTRAHEYVFLLTAAGRYFYDKAAVAEPSIHAGEIRTLGAKSLSKGQATGASVRPSGNANKDHVVVTDTRNMRSVWHLPTQPYREAHFATFPEAIPERCIKAGSRVGDVVLDPFCGSGTTGRVCRKLGRSFVGIDLNPAYLDLAVARITAPLTEDGREQAELERQGQTLMPFEA